MNGAARSRRQGIAVPAGYRDMIERGTLVAVNSSGGKDSQAMTILLSRIVPPRADDRHSCHRSREGRVAR